MSPDDHDIPRTIRFTRTRDGGRFALGPRWLRQAAKAAVLLGALGLWGLLEVFLAFALAAALRGDHPDDLAALVTTASWGLWLMLWTFGGFWGTLAFGRWALAREAISVSPDAWVHRQSLLGLRRTKRIDPRLVEAVRFANDVLWIETASRAITIATTGTSVDRAWLRELLRALVKPARKRTSTALAVSRLGVAPKTLAPPSGFRVTERFEEIVIEATPAARLRRLAPLALLCALWNGTVVVLVALAVVGELAGLGAHELGPFPVPALTNASWWLFISPFVLVGAVFATWLLATAGERTRYRLAPGRLEVERRTLRSTARTVYTRGALSLTRASSVSSGRPRRVHLLQVSAARGRREVFFLDRSSTRAFELALWISSHTGFPVSRLSESVTAL